MPRKKPSETTQARRFGVVLFVLFGALAGLSWYKGHPVRGGVLAGAAVVLLAWSRLAPNAWLPLFRLWMKLAAALSWVSTRILLVVFFFGVLTPVGLVTRVFRKSPLDPKWKDRATTYWIDREPVTDHTVERYQRQF